MSAPINPAMLFKRLAIWNGRKANPELSVPALARLLGMPESTVRRSVKLLETPPRELLEAYGHDAVASWLQAVPIAALKGDHRPAKDLLLHTRAIEPVQLQGQQSISIIFAAVTVPGLGVSPDSGQQITGNANEFGVIDARVVETPSAEPEVTAPTPATGPAAGSG